MWNYLRQLLQQGEGFLPESPSVDNQCLLERECYLPVQVARQPIFDCKGGLWGYELLFRDAQAGIVNNQAPVFANGTGSIPGGDVATSSVIADGFELVRPALQPGQRVLINFDTSLLLNDIGMVLPPEVCVVEILEHVSPTADVVDAVRRLKEQGYMVALDDYVGQDFARVFMPFADIVKVDVLGRSASEIMRDVALLRKYDVKMLAEKVEDTSTFGLCKALAFNLYQGFFLVGLKLCRGGLLVLVRQ